MPDRAPSNRPLYRGSSSISTVLRAGLDGFAVIAIAWASTMIVTGAFTIDYALALLALMAVMAVTYDQFDVYGSHSSFTAQTLALLRAWLATFGILVVLAFGLKVTTAYSRLVLAITFAGGLAAQLAIHVAFRSVHRAMKAGGHAAPSLIIGTGILADQLYHRIENDPWLLQRVVGAVTVGDREQAHTSANGRTLPVLGTITDTVRLVQEHGIRNVYIAMDLGASPLIESVYFNLLDRNVNVHWVPNIFALRLINHSIGEFAGLPILTLSETPLVGTRRVIKEVEDKLLGGIILLLAAPLMLIIGLAIKLDSRGPVFFRQPRTGWDGRVFRILKFRTMFVHDAPSGAIRQATRDDPRVTRVGRVLRRLSLDELPQLINVLAGDMSLVGPRPHEVKQNIDYSRKVSAYMARHRIKPGMTGLAQVRGYRGETRNAREMARRVDSDIEYINNWSLWLDLTILGRTLFALAGNKAY